MKSSTALPPQSAASKGPTTRRPRRRVRLTGAIVGVVMVVAVASGWALVARRSGAGAANDAQTKVPVSWQRPVVDGKGLEQRIGVKLVQVAVTGDGGLLDVRFQVVDPNTAADLHNAATPPAIVDEGTGIVASSLFMGHEHHAPYEVGLTYYLIFEDPGNVIRRGSKVSVLLGDAQVEHVVVR
jgi:cytochrome c-type biogenesis protein CcmE